MKSSLALLGLASVAPLAMGQTTFDGDAAGARLGEQFAVLPDINGDGVNDLLAGFPDDDTQGVDAGRAILISGADGSTLRTHYGENPGDRFGQVLSRGGQLDGDGVGDYLISATAWGNDQGAAYAFSGATGNSLLFMRGFDNGDLLGASLDRAGDVDNDGTGDVLVGATGVDTSGVDAGVVYVVSGATGTPLHALQPMLPFNTGLEFGQDVSWLGDINSDGHDDIFASSPNVDTDYPPGFYGIYSGIDGTLILSQAGYDDAHGFANHVGNGICSPGDVTGDGIPEFVTGQSDWLGHGWGLTEGHSLRVYDGATNDLLAYYGFGTYNNTSIEGPMLHLVNPVALGDVDGDGFSDLAYHSPHEELVRVVSARSTRLIGILPAPTAGLEFGVTIQGIDDVTGDGLRDVAIGIPGFDGPAGIDSGQIAVYSGDTCTPPTNYCSPELNSSGSRSYMDWDGSTSVSANDLVLKAYGAPANKVGLFFYGTNQVYLPVGDGRLCVGAGGLGLFRLNPISITNGSGDVSKAVDLTAAPSASGDGQISPGDHWNFQFWFRDPQGGPEGFNFSGGLEINFCP